jgi:hypothetical protein
MQRKRAQVMKSVLGEQRRQRNMGGVHSMDNLRLASCETTEWARDRALELGHDDAKVLGRRLFPPTTVTTTTTSPMDVTDEDYALVSCWGGDASSYSTAPSVASSASSSSISTVSTQSSAGTTTGMEGIYTLPTPPVYSSSSSLYQSLMGMGAAFNNHPTISPVSVMTRTIPLQPPSMESSRGLPYKDPHF